MSLSVRSLVGVIAADQPVELVAERAAVEPKFLAEGLEPADALPSAGAIEDVDRAIVEIAALVGLVVALAGDRRQLPRRGRTWPERNAAVLGLAA